MKTYILGCILVIFGIVITLGFFLGDNLIWLIGAILFIAYTLSLLILGVAIGNVFLNQGVDLTLKAQQVNDEYDIKKTASLVQFGKQIARLGNSDTNDGFSIENQAILDAPFEILGVDNKKD